jgi:formamidopyrimidine-DNA glycosylase
MHLGMTGRFSIDRADASHSSPKAPPSPTRLLKGGGGKRGGATPPFTFPLEGEVGRSSIGREGGEPPQASNGAKFDASPKALKHEHIVFHLADGVSVRYSDARRFGYMDLIPHEALAGHALFKGLGVEPLSDDFTAEWLAARLKGKATSMKAALVDQRLIAGLGNIYACEGLYRAGVSPTRLAGTLATKTGKPTKKTKALINGVKAVLKEAIRAGGSSLRDYAGADGRLGRFQHSFGVYGREGKPCRTKGCRGTVRRIVQSGRSTFYCPNCQR